MKYYVLCMSLLCNWVYSLEVTVNNQSYKAFSDDYLTITSLDPEQAVMINVDGSTIFHAQGVVEESSSVKIRKTYDQLKHKAEQGDAVHFTDSTNWLNFVVASYYAQHPLLGSVHSSLTLQHEAPFKYRNVILEANQHLTLEGSGGTLAIFADTPRCTFQSLHASSLIKSVSFFFDSTYKEPRFISGVIDFATSRLTGHKEGQNFLALGVRDVCFAFNAPKKESN